MIGDGVMSDRQLCEKCWPQNDFSMGAYSYRPSGHYPSINSIPTKHHRKRHTFSNGQQHSTIPQDGPLDAGSTYTAYLDAIGKLCVTCVYMHLYKYIFFAFAVINEKHQRMRAQSKYFHPLKPVEADAHESMIPGVAIISSLVATLVVVLIALMCVMRWRSKEPGEQEYGLSHSIQQW